jgi:hypothetical protein
MGSTTGTERVALLRELRFEIADSWPQTPEKKRIVRVLDAMIEEETEAS